MSIVSQLLLIPLSFLCALFIRFEFQIPAVYFKVFLKTVGVLVLWRVGALYYFTLFRGLWRYVTISDVVEILKATVGSSALFIITLFLWKGHTLGGLPRSVLVLDWMLFTGGMLGIRFISRFYRESIRFHQTPASKIRKMLIIGVTDEGVRLAKDIQNNPLLSIKVSGFLSQSERKGKEKIIGIPILGQLKDLTLVLEKYSIDQVMIAAPDLPAKTMSSIIRKCERGSVACGILPATDELLDHLPRWRVLKHGVREVMGREVVNLTESPPRLDGEVAMVTGAAGSIGSELCRQLARIGPSRLLMLDQSESGLYELERELEQSRLAVELHTTICDITNVAKIRKVIEEAKPHSIFHAAAYKHVPLMEKDPLEAIATNVLGTYYLAKCARDNGVDRMLLVSTDKAVNPVSVMGKTKLAAERTISSLGPAGTSFMAVRFGNVLNSNGSVVPLFRRQVEMGGPVTVTDPEVTRYFMAIEEAVHLILHAGSMGRGNEIFMLDMGEPVKILDVAEQIIMLADLKPYKDIDIVFTGLRPGERLNEELYWFGEGIQPTSHPEIVVMRNGNHPLADLDAGIAALEKCCQMQDEKGALSLLDKLIAGTGAK